MSEANESFFEEVKEIYGFIRYTFWPPFLSRIISKMALHPPIPTYHFVFNERKNKYIIRYEIIAEKLNQKFLGKRRWRRYKSRSSAIDVFHSNTRRGNIIACIFIRGLKDSKFTVLYSHSNAADLGFITGYLWYLRKKTNCNIFAYDYSGFGLSSGKPSENNLLFDIESAVNSLITRYDIHPESVILYGESMGSVPTIDMSSRHKFAGVVLHSSFMSGLRALLNRKLDKTLFFDPFPNIEKVNKIECPVLVIHGTKDEIIDISQAYAIHERCKNAVTPLWVEGATHNYIQLFPQFYTRLRQFIDYDLKLQK